MRSRLVSVLPRRQLESVDLATDHAGLPPSLIAAIEAEGGLWRASDGYTTPTEIVERALEVGAVALRLDVRDLSFLSDLPGIRYLHLRSDGRPPLDPIGSLRDLRALILEVGAVRGSLDPLAFPELRWLRIKLGGKGGAAAFASLQRGHPGLRWLAVGETRIRSVEALVSGLPSLTNVSIHFADFLRELGDLASVTPKLEAIRLDFTGIRSLAGLEALQRLTIVDLTGGDVTDLGPVGRSQGLRYARLLAPDASSIETLRRHPNLRMLGLQLDRQPPLDVIDSMPELVAVWRGHHFEGPIHQVDLSEVPLEHPLRREWHEAMRQ